MGIFTRPDSPYFWFWIEGTTHRGSTGVPRKGHSPTHERQLRLEADGIYAAKKVAAAKHAAGLTPEPKPSITFDRYAAWYQTHVADHQRGGAKVKSRIAHLSKTFGPLPLTAIDAHRVREWMTAELARGLKAPTVNRSLDDLKAMLTKAVPKYLAASPLGEVRRFRVVEQEPRTMTTEEEQRLLAVATKEERAWFLMAVDTLLRLSNVANLEWAQVRLDERVIVPLNAKVSIDAVPITPRMKAALERLPHDSRFVFAELHRNGKGPTAAKNKAIRAFDGLCQRAGVPHGRQAHGLTFHCLRHTGATRALSNGASVRTVMRLGGWKDLRSVLRYTHATDADVRKAAESIGRTHVVRT